MRVCVCGGGGVDGAREMYVIPVLFFFMRVSSLSDVRVFVVRVIIISINMVDNIERTYTRAIGRQAVEIRNV